MRDRDLIVDGENLGKTYMAGYIDASGEYVIEPKFESAGSFKNVLAHVKIDDETEGYINKTGKIVYSWYE